MEKSKLSVNDLKNALDKSEFVFYYQPQVSLISGKLDGAEALIRWHTADGKIILPNDFIPLAEESGFITEITYHMFDKFVEDVSLIHDLDETLTLSINLSAKDVDNDALLDKISYAVNNGLIDRHGFAVELTETAVSEHLSSAQNYYSYFQNMNIQLIMDDFGTGYANISSLVNTPFTKIKLDHSIIKNLGKSEKDSIVIIENIRMAHRLGMDVVAEGIESEDIYNILQNNGCTMAQGYFASRPLPLPEFIDKFVSSKKMWRSTPMGLLHMAQLDHIQWRKDLIDMVFYPSKVASNTEMYSQFIINPTACMLGKWYYGEGRIFAHSKEFRKLEEPHNELHIVGHQLIVESRKKSPSMEKLIELAKQLTHYSLKISEVLYNFEHFLFMNRRGSEKDVA